jgi:hypothetical protein
VALVRDRPPGEGHNTLGRSKVDISEHLALHEDIIRSVAWWYANDVNDFEDAYQAIVTVMIDRHERGTYDHDDDREATLLSYVYRAIIGTASQEVDKYQHYRERDAKGRPITVVVPPADLDDEGISNLEELQEQVGNPDRPGSIGEPRVKPINWYGGGYGEQPSTLTPEELELAEKLKAYVTDEERIILDVSIQQRVLADGRHVPISEETASEVLTELGYKMSRSTYRRRLMEIKEKVKPLLPGYMIFSGDE